MWKDLILRKDRKLSAQKTTLPGPDFSRIKSLKKKKKLGKGTACGPPSMKSQIMFQRLRRVTGVLGPKHTMWITDKIGADIKRDSLDA